VLCVTGSGYADGTFGPITPPDYSALPKTLVGTQQQRDLNVKATLLRHGNWDSLNNAVIWDANIPDHTIPNSLYLTGKPSWWGDLPWPPIGPDRSSYGWINPGAETFRNAVSNSKPGPTVAMTLTNTLRPAPAARTASATIGLHLLGNMAPVKSTAVVPEAPVIVGSKFFVDRQIVGGMRGSLRGHADAGTSFMILSISTKMGRLRFPTISQNVWPGRGFLAAGVDRNGYRYFLRRRFFYLHRVMKPPMGQRHDPLYQYSKTVPSGISRSLFAPSSGWPRRRRNHSAGSYCALAGQRGRAGWHPEPHNHLEKHRDRPGSRPHWSSGRRADH